MGEEDKGRIGAFGECPIPFMRAMDTRRGVPQIEAGRATSLGLAGGGGTGGCSGVEGGAACGCDGGVPGRQDGICDTGVGGEEEVYGGPAT